MNTMKNGLRLAVVAALALPIAAQAALQYTPPQAMVLTCNGSAPNVLNKTSALATFACANGQVPQAVGVTSGLAGMLGLASGASILAASEAVPQLALPSSAPASGSPASGNSNGSGAANGSGNGSGNGANGSGGGSGANGAGNGANGSSSGSGGNGSGSGGNGSGAGNGSNSSNASGKGSNSGSSAGSGSGSGLSNGSSSGGGGFLGHLLHSVGQAVQQVGQAVMTGGEASIPLMGGGNASSGLTPIAEGGPIRSNQLFGGSPDGTYNFQATAHYPAGGGSVTLLFGEHPNSNSLWWLISRERTQGGKLPFRYAVSLNPPKMLSGAVVRTGQGEAFCEAQSGSSGDFEAPIQFEALTCRPEQDGQLAVFSPNNAVQFTVPDGQYSYAYTNLYGNNPNYFMQKTTNELRRTAGYVFPVQDLRANASFAHLAKWTQEYGSCVAGVVVHHRGNVPMIYQAETYVPSTPAPTVAPISSMTMTAAAPAPTSRASVTSIAAAANPACFGRLGYTTQSLLAAAGIVRESEDLGTATPELYEHGTWVTSPYPAQVIWEGPAQDNASIPSYVRQALATESLVGGKSLAAWGVPERQNVTR